MQALFKPACDRVAPSVAAELAWLLDLLVQDAPYAEPALAELERSLLPGIGAHRLAIKDRLASLWRDRLPGCPELLIEANSGGCLEDTEIRRLLAWLSTRPKESSRRYELLTEPAQHRRLIRRRLATLDSDIRLRRQYRNIIADLWQLAGPAWERRGRAAAAKASADWSARLERLSSVMEFVQLMPPRHPLARDEEVAITSALRRRRRIVIVPMYFCMSGGNATDLGDRVLVGVPASAREPVRRIRDAAFVADRVRIFSESTRVRILIHMMAAPSGVMETTRALGLSQPTVSEHIRQLTKAGLVRRERRRTRTVYVASPPRVDRILEDARKTLTRWA
jgi:ArsR family transcriptional regulator